MVTLIGLLYLALIWLFCAAIASAVTQVKQRGINEGLALGAILGPVGIVVAVCLATELPAAPEGMIAVQCPRCNAVQNVPDGDEKYECWQCDTVAAAPGFEDN